MDCIVSKEGGELLEVNSEDMSHWTAQEEEILARAMGITEGKILYAEPMTVDGVYQIKIEVAPSDAQMDRWRQARPELFQKPKHPVYPIWDDGNAEV